MEEFKWEPLKRYLNCLRIVMDPSKPHEGFNAKTIMYSSNQYSNPRMRTVFNGLQCLIQDSTELRWISDHMSLQDLSTIHLLGKGKERKQGIERKMACMQCIVYFWSPPTRCVPRNVRLTRERGKHLQWSNTFCCCHVVLKFTGSSLLNNYTDGRLAN